jgi:cytochrome c551/c552
MKNYRQLFSFIVLVSASLTCGGVTAQAPSAPVSAKPVKALSIKLPAETASLKPSTLPGYQIAMQKCGICHSADYIKLQPPAMSQAQWTAEVRKMEHAYAAPLSDTDVTQIGEYLAVTYGAAKASGMTPATALPAVAAANAALDVQKLLASNACLGCHATVTKIVGPAYHDVALKYKNDAQAQAKLEASIRGGSAGKWGAVPMPAFAALSAQELKALAAFVLQQ